MKYMYFWGSFCSPCKQLSPIMERINHQGIPVQKIDVEKQEELTSEWGIQSVPTVILVDNGGFELSRIVGSRPESFYVELYRKNMNNLSY